MSFREILKLICQYIYSVLTLSRLIIFSYQFKPAVKHDVVRGQIGGDVSSCASKLAPNWWRCEPESGRNLQAHAGWIGAYSNTLRVSERIFSAHKLAFSLGSAQQ